MAASTITRATWTNDSGTPAAPVGDGTVINNTRLQNDIYATIDQMFAGAGAYATFTFGGLVAAQGFGTHTFSAGGTGGNIFKIQNTTAGTGNFAQVIVGNDVDTLGRLTAYSSTFSASGASQPNATVLHSQGGLHLNAGPSAGASSIKFFTGDSERGRISGGVLFMNDTSEANITIGMCLNQGANVNRIQSWKQSNVAHAMTAGSGSLAAETDTYGSVGTTGGDFGGLSFTSFSEAVTTAYSPFTFSSAAPNPSGDTTKSTAAQGFFRFQAVEYSGGVFAAIDANENIAVFANSASVRFILDGDGDSHQDVGTAWTNFDDFDDHELLSALSAGVSRKGDPLKRAFGSLLKKHKKTLEQARIVTFNKDGHHFVNWSRLNMLKVGAIRQNAMRIAALEQENAALGRRLAAIEAS